MSASVGVGTTATDSAAAQIAELIRPDLRGRGAYGAPQLDVPVQLNTNENSYPCLLYTSRCV